MLVCTALLEVIALFEIWLIKRFNHLVFIYVLYVYFYYHTLPYTILQGIHEQVSILCGLFNTLLLFATDY